MILYEHYMERKLQDLKFNAILHGADPKELGDKVESEDRKENLMFGDPKEYEKWSPEERKKISDKMLNKFTKWAKGS
jgi:hypothetical protein